MHCQANKHAKTDPLDTIPDHIQKIHLHLETKL